MEMEKRQQMLDRLNALRRVRKLLDKEQKAKQNETRKAEMGEWWQEQWRLAKPSSNLDGSGAAKDETSAQANAVVESLIGKLIAKSTKNGIKKAAENGNGKREKLLVGKRKRTVLEKVFEDEKGNKKITKMRKIANIKDSD